MSFGKLPTTFQDADLIYAWKPQPDLVGVSFDPNGDSRFADTAGVLTDGADVASWMQP